MPALVMLLSLITFHSNANTSFQIKDIHCSDFDQYYVGEACELTLIHSNQKITLIADLYEFYHEFQSDSSLLNKYVSLNLDSTRECVTEEKEELRIELNDACFRIPYGKLKETLSF